MKVTRAPNNLPQVFASKTVTFTGAANLGAAGPVPWFTTTGQVLILYVAGIVEVNTAGTIGDTLSLGVTGSTTLLIAAATTANLQTSAPLWLSAAPTASGLAMPAGTMNMGITANVIGTVVGTAFTAGRIRVSIWYSPMVPGAGLA